MSDRTPSLIVRIVPALGWLGGYRREWLRGDAIAGITLAAYLMPAGIGDASLAGLPPEAGLYACLFSGLVFWLFTSSRQTTVTVTSAISLLVGSTLGPLAAGDPARYAAMASTTALMVAALALTARLFHAGAVVNFISESVLVGFKCGVALYLTSSQLPKLCGIKGGHGDFWEKSADFIQHAGSANPTSLAMGITALAALFLCNRFFPKIPAALVVVLAGLLLGSNLDLAGRGVKMLGEVPQGLPNFGVAGLNRSDLNTLLPLAMACFLLGSVETAAIGRMFARKHEYRLDSKRPEYFEQAGILIDVIDSRTNKLVYRNHVKGDVVRGASDATRASRIDAAVGQALAPFFRKNQDSTGTMDSMSMALSVQNERAPWSLRHSVPAAAAIL